MRRMFLCCVLLLVGCSTTSTDLSQGGTDRFQAVWKNGCAMFSYADGAFKASAPGLAAVGKLSPDAVQKERVIFEQGQVLCANPPADPIQAGIQLLGMASNITILMTQRQ